jgi:hypothetical protein
MGFLVICSVLQLCMRVLRGGFLHVCEIVFYFVFSDGGKVIVYVVSCIGVPYHLVIR